MMTNSPRSTYVAVGQAEIHVAEWGDPANVPLVMWHGLARTGRDFDEVAAALSDRWFVVCPDTLGRGQSSWAEDPTVGYSYKSYGDHALAVLDHFGIGEFAWVGTSMGGLLGVTLAAARLKNRITHLVVNDVGPWIPEEATGRIAAYVGNPPVFDTIAELEGWLRANYKPFGANSDSFWRRMAETSARRMDNGRITVHYDPAIVSQFTHHRSDLDCWPQWDQVSATTLLLRGEHSDVLPGEVAAQMRARGPKPAFREFPGVGHAPTLATDDETLLLRQFLLGELD